VLNEGEPTPDPVNPLPELSVYEVPVPSLNLYHAVKLAD